MDFPGWKPLNFASLLRPLEVLPFDLYLAWSALHTLNETLNRVAGADICLGDPMTQSRLTGVFDILIASNFKINKAKY